VAEPKPPRSDDKSKAEGVREMTSHDETITPRHVLCVLGKWKNFDAVEPIIAEYAKAGFEFSREYSQLTPDDRMMASFEVCYDRVEPTMAEADWQSVREHSAVAYVLSPPIERDQADRISGQALLLIDALLKGGGTAAKGESAGVAHGRDRWIEMAFCATISCLVSCVLANLGWNDFSRFALAGSSTSSPSSC
jgi:hypothetical protein